MSADDPPFLDYLAGVMNEIRRYSNDLADAADRQFDAVATQLREALSRAEWLPENARPSAPRRFPPSAPSANTVLALSSSPRRLLRFTKDWISRHPAIFAAIVAFAGTTAVMIFGMKVRYGKRRKRRAKRAANGARTEVVVIVGPVTAPLTRSLALDLERRGFLVYIVVNAVEDEQVVQNESRVDIRPLLLDIGNPSSTEEAMKRFEHLLTTPQQAVVGATPNKLHLAGVILAPEINYPSGPVETVAMQSWSDIMNYRVLGTIATVQEFLKPVCRFQSRLLMLTPNNIPSIKLPFHAPQSTAIGALTGFFTTLQNELDTIGIRICHLKLGAINFSALHGRYPQQQQKTTFSQSQLSTLSWPAPSRSLYAQNYQSQLEVASLFPNDIRRRDKQSGAPIRELHAAVFDALTQERPARVWRVGHGIHSYEIIGRLMPRGAVSWMLGMRKVSSLPEKRKGQMTPVEKHDNVLDASRWEEVEKIV